MRKNKRYVKHASGWRCPPARSARHPKAAPHIHREGAGEQDNLRQSAIKNLYGKQLSDMTFAA